VTTDDHPFLLCERAQFRELRERARREPWRTMYEDAVARVDEGPAGDGPDHPATLLQRYLGARALLYVVEEADRREHAAAVRDAIVDRLAEIAFDPDRAWSGTVPPMGAAFVSILALDVVHDGLAREAIDECEAVIERRITEIPREGSWPAARYGTYGTWEIYTGERTEPDDAFYENYVTQMTGDGVTTVSPNYAFARLGSQDDRPQKTGYADVLEFTGIDDRYYDEPRLKRFYRWLYGASVDPAKQFHMFGDTIVTNEPPNAALMWRVGRFDRRAAARAAWLLEDEEPPGHLLSYVLMDEPLPEPAVPRSRLFEDGEAVFREPADDPERLGAALYNVTENDEWHTHEEINAIACSAYGTRLLVNGGWLGDETRPPWRNNTVAVDDERHAEKTGAGIIEGLLADGVDYACGHSGDALGDDAFRRSLVQVHGRDGCGGYFAVIDEVDAGPESTVRSYLQPATETEPAELTPWREYRATIDHHARRDGVACSILYASGPEAVSSDPVPSGSLDRNPEAGRHYRLTARYDTDERGNRCTLTVLFPHDRSHPKAALSRVEETGATGARVDHGDGVTDLLLASGGKRRIETAGVSLQAGAVLRRRREDGGNFYFARRGRELIDGPRGFESTHPVSIFVRGTEGCLTARRRGELTLHAPGVTGVRVDGQPVGQPDPGRDRVRFEVPPGRHGIVLETGKRR